jgi:hypothetical protein
VRTIAQYRITSTKAMSEVTLKFRALRRIDFVTRSPSSGMMPRRNGENHPSVSCRGSMCIGNIPCVYAYSNVSGARSAPTATTSSSVGHLSGEGKPHAQLSCRGISPASARGDDQYL